MSISRLLWKAVSVPMSLYRLKSSILAVEYIGNRTEFINLSAGEILRVHDQDKQRGLMKIEYRGRTVAVFVQDLRERSDRIEAYGA